MPSPLPAYWNEPRLRAAVKAAGVALWSWHVDTDALDLDDVALDLWSIPHRRAVCFEDLSEKIHPADRTHVRAAFNATKAIIGAYEIDFRILVGEEIRWISARGQGPVEGAPERVVLGIFLDVTGRKLAEEGHELLAGEMSHRVKNLLNLATGLTAIAARSAASARDMAQDLIGRLSALARAHDLARPVPGGPPKATMLGDLIKVVLAPYDDMGAFNGRIRVAAPPTDVGEASATALALILHELATNSMKYGALSVEAGTLDIACAPPGPNVVLVWTERGGPPVTPPPSDGYGSSMIARSMSRQLGGSLLHVWDPGGLIVTINVSARRLAD